MVKYVFRIERNGFIGRQKTTGDIKNLVNVKDVGFFSLLKDI